MTRSRRVILRSRVIRGVILLFVFAAAFVWIGRRRGRGQELNPR